MRCSLLCLFFTLLGSTFPLLGGVDDEPDNPGDRTVDPALIKPVAPVVLAPEDPDHVRWRALIAQSLRFMLIQQAFRLGTETATRSPGIPFFHGWAESVNGLHGWADGDPFIVNYIGHPMQGAVSGFVWVQNDGRYRHAEFGRSRAYWRGKLRAAGYAWAYSELFELGPLSEATIGHTQAFYPQQGLVDHVVTPAIGLGWMVTEDAVDRYVVRWIEGRTDNRVVKILVRGGLNPSRSLANMLAGQVPWWREQRILYPERRVGLPTPVAGLPPEPRAYPTEAPFELTVAPRLMVPLGGAGPCVGGGGTAALRLSSDVQWMFDVGGCRQLDMRENLSGDLLTALTGPRWSASPGGRWNSYVQVLVGGMKATTEEIFPDEKAALEAEMVRAGLRLGVSDHAKYTKQADTAGLAFSVGAGIEKKLNSALAIRVASLDYTRSFMGPLEGMGARGYLQFGGGLVLRMGTW